MNALVELHKDYMALSDALADVVPGRANELLRTAELALEQETVNAQTLAARLQALAAKEDLVGWQLLPSELRILPGQRLITDQPMLECQLRCGEHYIQVRHLQGDRWRWQQARLLEGERENHNVLIEPHCHLATDFKLGKLRFLRLWSLDDSGALSLQHSLFDGFEGEPA